ncbi:MAG TPA: IS5 family transposase [Candidatus Bathyarchaeia archaeon]|nr:IS5 family transposase [Candidatus Bathyarchaeia archaeon]
MADLTDVQWERIRPLVEFAEPRRADHRGRPWRQARQVLNGMLWVLRTGAPWHDLPERYGPYQTCHRRFQQWQRAGVLDGILWALAEDLLARGQLGLEETFIDASFMGAKKGANCVGRTLIGKGTKLMAIADCHGLPIALWIASATPHEQKLVDATVEHRFVAEKPKRLIADKGYDSDALDDLLAEQHGIELIAPHRRYRTRTHRQDRRKLRRYKRRWKIERLFAWLKNFRRLLVRWERHSNNFLGMVQLACMLILLRRL